MKGEPVPFDGLMPLGMNIDADPPMPTFVGIEFGTQPLTLNARLSYVDTETGHVYRVELGSVSGRWMQVEAPLSPDEYEALERSVMAACRMLGWTVTKP